MLTTPGEPAHVQRSSSPPTPPTGTSTLAREASARQPPTVGCSHERRQHRENSKKVPFFSQWNEVWDHFGSSLPRGSIIHAWNDRSAVAEVREKKDVRPFFFVLLPFWLVVRNDELPRQARDRLTDARKENSTRRVGVRHAGYRRWLLRPQLAGLVPTPVNISTTACQIQTVWSPRSERSFER
jgi:hypothetical protein